jgi:hypothetical protein
MRCHVVGNAYAPAGFFAQTIDAARLERREHWLIGGKDARGREKQTEEEAPDRCRTKHVVFLLLR